MLRVFYSVIIIALLLKVHGQYTQSPCPNIFEYKNDESGVYGLLHIPPIGAVSTLTVKANFTISARVVTLAAAKEVVQNYAGSIQPMGSEQTLLEDFNKGVPINYRVIFPIIDPLPRLTMLSVNDNPICYGPGDVPDPNQYITTIGLEHILYYKSGGDQDFRPKPVHPKRATPPQNVDDNQVLISYDTPWEINTDDVKPFKPSRPPFGRPPHPPRGRGPPEWHGPPPRWEQRPAEGPPPVDRWRPPSNNGRGPPHRPPRPPPTIEMVYQTPVRQPSMKPVTQPPIEVEVESNSYEECGVNGVNSIVPLVFNGDSYEKGKWPWLVALFKRRSSSLSYICAGTLVSERHVVTAAHCMKRKSVSTSMRDIVVKAGVYNLDDWADDNVITSNLQAAAIHESYNASSLANDILVMTLKKPVRFSENIRPACLWSGKTDLNLIIGSSGVVAGWGANEFGPAGRGEPRMVRMPVVSTATCRASKPDFHRLTSSNTLCAGDRNGAGPCLGDSGGGLYIQDSNTGRWRLRGVVSISLVDNDGSDSCNLNEYIVFTDTAQYLQWIKSAMNTEK